MSCVSRALPDLTARRRKIKAILSNGDVPYAAAYRASMVRVGSGGKSNLFSPGRLSVPFAETKGTRDCHDQHGDVRNSMQRGTVTRWLPQSPSVTAPSRRELLCAPSFFDKLKGAPHDGALLFSCDFIC